MAEVLIFATVIAPIILGLVELVKRTAGIPANFIPLVALFVGILVGYLGYIFTDLDLAHRLWAGGLAGLAATGLFEMVNDRSKGVK